MWPHQSDAPARYRQCHSHDDYPWLWAPGAWHVRPTRPPLASTAALCTVPRQTRHLAVVWPCDGCRNSHASLRQWLSPSPTMPNFDRVNKACAPGVAGTHKTHCDSPASPHTTLTPAISIGSQRETHTSTRLVGKKKGRLLQDLAFHPQTLIFLPQPMQFFLLRTQTTVAWKGIRTFLLQCPFPLPQHSGMNAQITSGFTDSIAVIALSTTPLRA